LRQILEPLSCVSRCVGSKVSQFLHHFAHTLSTVENEMYLQTAKWDIKKKLLS
jgi:hypothetical protein